MQSIRTAFDAELSLAQNRQGLARTASDVLRAAGLPSKCGSIERIADGSVMFAWTLTAPSRDDYGIECGRVAVTFSVRNRTVWEWESRVLYKHWLGVTGPYDEVVTPACVRDVSPRRHAACAPPKEFVAFVRVNRELLDGLAEQKKRAERRAKAKRRGA